LLPVDTFDHPCAALPKSQRLRISSIAKLQRKIVVSQTIAIVIETITNLWQALFPSFANPLSVITNLRPCATYAKVGSAGFSGPRFYKVIISLSIAVVILAIAGLIPRQGFTLTINDNIVFVAKSYTRPAVTLSCRPCGTSVTREITCLGDHRDVLITP
jgi:hypothetical protein